MSTFEYLSPLVITPGWQFFQKEGILGIYKTCEGLPCIFVRQKSAKKLRLNQCQEIKDHILNARLIEHLGPAGIYRHLSIKSTNQRATWTKVDSILTNSFLMDTTRPMYYMRMMEGKRPVIHVFQEEEV